MHWSRIPVEEKEAGEAEGKPYVYDTKVRLNPVSYTHLDVYKRQLYHHSRTME